MATLVVLDGVCSGRAACRYLGLGRSTYRYLARPPCPQRERLVVRTHELSALHPRYGYRRIVALLRQEGWATSRKQVQRLRRAEGLRVSPSRRRQSRRGLSTGLPTQATHRGHVWTWDFVADATVHGGTLRMLTVLDEHTKEVHVLRPERRIGSAGVIALVKTAIAAHGAPEFIRSDNGAEFIAHDLQRWLADQHIKTIYITPASPWENGFVESFHSRFHSRVPQPRAALDPDRGSRGHRRLPPGLQLGPTPQLARLPVAPALRRPLSFNPSLRSASDLPPRGIAKPTSFRHINHPSGLTLFLAPIPRPRQ
jgi:transposase InsO family protein